MTNFIISKILRKYKIIKNFNSNTYYRIKYPSNKIMIIDDNFDFCLLQKIFCLTDYSFIFANLKNYDDLDNLIINEANNKGIIDKDFIFFKVNSKDIQKYTKIIKPNYILIGENEEIINNIEINELFDSATIISLLKYEFKDISYSIDSKKADFYISNIDYIKENIEVNKKYVINITKTDKIYLNEILMLLAFFISCNLDYKLFNKANTKSFSYENKRIFLNISNNNYNDSIKFSSRYTDYKIIVIGWKNLYEDISWLYNVEFERLFNKNIQKIYCIGTNAFDIATRLKYADLNEKIIVASSNIDIFLRDIMNYNLNVYVLTDEYYINVIKGGKK